MTKDYIAQRISDGLPMYHITIDEDVGQRTVRASCKLMRPQSDLWIALETDHAIYRTPGADVRGYPYNEIHPDMGPIIREAHMRGDRQPVKAP